MFLLHLAIVLGAAALGGYISRKLNQPTVLGQLVFGILIGPSLLNLVQPTEIFVSLSELGVVLLMFIAGLETDLNDMIKSGKSSMAIAAGGVMLPIILGTAASMLFGNPFQQSIFIGIILAATSVSITVETLREIDKLRTKQGIAILSAAIIDDVIGIVLLSLVTGLIKPGEGTSFVFVIVKLLIFLVLSIVVGFIIIRLSKKYFSTRNTMERIGIVALAFCLVFGFMAEELGVAAITGAYMAGIILSETPFKSKVSLNVQQLSYLLLTPIFFVVTGMKVDLNHMLNDVPFGLVLLAAAVLGKLLGCGLISKAIGFSNRESLQIGIGMVPRGEVVLIVTDIGLRMGVIPKGIFASVIFMILITMITTPPLLKKSFEKGA